VEFALAPVLGEARGVVANAVGEVVPEEVELLEEAEVDGGVERLAVEVRLGRPRLERLRPRAVLEERLEVVAVIVGPLNGQVVVLVGVAVELGRVRCWRVERHAWW